MWKRLYPLSGKCHGFHGICRRLSVRLQVIGFRCCAGSERAFFRANLSSRPERSLTACVKSPSGELELIHEANAGIECRLPLLAHRPSSCYFDKSKTYDL